MPSSQVLGDWVVPIECTTWGEELNDLHISDSTPSISSTGLETSTSTKLSNGTSPIIVGAHDSIPCSCSPKDDHCGVASRYICSTWRLFLSSKFTIFSGTSNDSCYIFLLETELWINHHLLIIIQGPYGFPSIPHTEPSCTEMGCSTLVYEDDENTVLEEAIMAEEQKKDRCPTQSHSKHRNKMFSYNTT